MTTITIASPKHNPQSKRWSVFSTYEGEDDRFVFGVREFGVDEQEEAEKYAGQMMERHQADHLERLA